MFKKKPPQVEERTFAQGKQVLFSYTILRSTRKTLVLRINRKAEVILGCPWQLTQAEIDAFLEKNALKVARHLQSLKVKQKRALKFEEGELHYYLGQKYPITLVKGFKSKVEFDGKVFKVHFRGSGKTEVIQSVLNDFYKQESLRFFKTLIQQKAEKWGLAPEEIPVLRVKKMVSRWGSLSGRGYINLNTELMKAPEPLIDYVIEHEFCHLVHMNHSSAYYKLLTQKMPDWKKRKVHLEEFFKNL